MSNYAIKAAGLCKKYGDFEIKGLDISLQKGCIMGLIGENGAGKSTLIRLLLHACDRCVMMKMSAFRKMMQGRI